MKKMLSLISALTMCAVMAAPIASSAEDGDETTTTAPKTSSTVTATTKDGVEIPEGEKASSDVTLSDTVADSYTVVIPAGTADVSSPATLEVSAADVVISPGATLDITVTSANNWSLVNESNKEVSIGYKLTDENDSALTVVEDTEDTEDAEGAEVTKVTKYSVLSVASKKEQKASGATTLTATVTGTATMAGTYEDTLTFEVAVNTPTSSTPSTLGT